MNMDTEEYLTLLEESVGTRAAMWLCINSAKKALGDSPQLCDVKAAERYLRWYQALYAKVAAAPQADGWRENAEALRRELDELFGIGMKKE